MVEINRAIGESDYIPLLMMDWGERNWFLQRDCYKNLRPYGTDSRFPTFSTRVCNIVKPTALLFEDYKDLVLQPDFQKDFWGSSGAEVSAHIKANFPNWLEAADVNFGRRMMIEWFVTDKRGDFIGFIHLTCMYPAFPYEWVVEFGLKKSWCGRGVMKCVLQTITEWAQQNGCERILAISEIYNEAAHRVIASLPYVVQERTTSMGDQFGGFRQMKNFIIDLNSTSGQQRISYFNQAVAYYREKAYAEAIGAFERALAEPYPQGTPYTDAQIYSNMGMAMSSMGLHRDAFIYLKRAQSLGLTNPNIEKELLWLKSNFGFC